ncbi:DUF748 domain-containing protein [Pseudomonas sp. 1928-m]|uniref:DUF748 domain-containing protein n=1 Tax=Pseudomonas sp. 1928-m TaxID=3033804 RepID=UPI0023DF7937|nr:DUF748 domain-containing protein [Pseudomonas sp. 1928-m]MDF3195854.1 DUF748 domain-containing protein [Pseudomonas sp. 1928-m]
MKRRYSIPQWILLGLLATLLVLHFTLPILVRDYLNDKLAEMGSYSGHITDVDLAWWRGAYQINGLEIVKTGGHVRLPFVEVPVIDLAVSWNALWYKRAIVAEVIFEQPVLNFVDGGADSQASQTGEGTDWREQLKKLLPITLDEARVLDGRVHFHNFTSDPPVELQASNVNASVYNLTTVADEQGKRVAHFEGKAQLLGHAPLEATASFDPLEDFENFVLKLRATGIELPQVNSFSSAYGKFDFKAGTGDLVVEARADDGELSGYIKPLLRNVEVFDWEQDVTRDDKGFFRSVWEAIVGGSEKLLKNQRVDQFATRVELSGNVHQQNISAFQAFIAILRNGFIQAFSTRFESSLEEGDSAPSAE